MTTTPVPVVITGADLISAAYHSVRHRSIFPHARDLPDDVGQRLHVLCTEDFVGAVLRGWISLNGGHWSMGGTTDAEWWAGETTNVPQLSDEAMDWIEAVAKDKEPAAS